MQTKQSQFENKEDYFAAWHMCAGRLIGLRFGAEVVEKEAAAAFIEKNDVVAHALRNLVVVIRTQIKETEAELHSFINGAKL